MNIKIKYFEELNTTELYEILKLRQSVFVVEQNCPYNDVDEFDPLSVHLMMIEGDELIGYTRITEKDTRYPEVSIGRFLVKKDFRHSGFGDKLFTRAIDYITDDMKEDTIKIQAQTYMKDYYAKKGFKEISKAYLEDNIEHVDMLYKKD